MVKSIVPWKGLTRGHTEIVAAAIDNLKKRLIFPFGMAALFLRVAADRTSGGHHLNGEFFSAWVMEKVPTVLSPHLYLFPRPIVQRA